MARDARIDAAAESVAAPDKTAQAAQPEIDFPTMVKMAYRANIDKGRETYEQLQEDCRHPREVQEELLFGLLRENAETPFAKEYGFDSIKTIEDFKRTVPFTTYDDYAGWIYEVMEKGTQGLVCKEPIVHFCETSGTMGNPKGIPYTDRSSSILFTYGNDYGIYLISQELGDVLEAGRKFNMTECRLSTLKGGCTYGALSSKAMWDWRSMLPLSTTSPDPAVFSTNETDTRYLHARYMLAERDVRYANTTFSSLFLDLVRYMVDNWRMLVEDIESGTINPEIQLPEEARRELEQALVPMPERAAELRDIFEGGLDDPIMPRIWPNLAVINTVAGAGFAPYTERLRKYSGDIPVFYVGYAASEGLFSVPEKLNSPESILIPRAAYFEFLPLGEDDPLKTIGLEDLQPGCDYEVIVTNLAGFYRYKMRDAIRCVGYHDKAPKMEFLFRVDQTVNMKGEKCTEMVLRKAADRIASRLGLDLVDFSCYPNVDAQPPRYEILFEFFHMPEGACTLEELSRVTDEEIREGCADFDDMRENGDFDLTQVQVLQEQTYQLWRDMRIMKGAAPNQIKPVHIIDTDQKRRFFYALVERD